MARSRNGNGLRISRLHAAVQSIVAGWLEAQGFDASVEEFIGEDLVADVYAESPWGSIIVEVETGFIDPKAVATPERYLLAKILVKASRYSRYADAFAVAFPSFVQVDGAALQRILSGDLSILGGGGAWEVIRLVKRPRLGSLLDARVDAILSVNVSERIVKTLSLTDRGFRVLGGLCCVEQLPSPLHPI
ncbi:MAG: hypothetical protein F7C09_03250 [Aeropyrum sp.]|nr:hypothetical protein [Aeropyrum sp.]